MPDRHVNPYLRRHSGVQRFIPLAVKIIYGGILGFFAFSVVSVSIFAFVPIPMTPLVAIRAIEAGFRGRPVYFEKEWASIDEMPPNLLRAAVASEDFRFTEHRGFDFGAIEKAMKANERVQRRGRGKIRGASTISQQTAKNVFLFPSRTWLRKGLETWMTILIESIWSKRRILEVYLNVVELGDGVYGVQAASEKFFRKSVRNLNASEAALLIAVLPNPRILRVNQPSTYVRYRQAAILRRLSYVDIPD
jgi:monofunctional biosynthetic peptidoglycan transglycosylase